MEATWLLRSTGLRDNAIKTLPILSQRTGQLQPQERINLYMMISSGRYLHIFVSWLFWGFLLEGTLFLLVCLKDENKSVVNMNADKRLNKLLLFCRLTSATQSNRHHMPSVRSHPKRLSSPKLWNTEPCLPPFQNNDDEWGFVFVDHRMEHWQIFYSCISFKKVYVSHGYSFQLLTNECSLYT